MEGATAGNRRFVWGRGEGWGRLVEICENVEICEREVRVLLH